MWTRAIDKAQRAPLKAQRKNSRGKSLLSKKEQTSGSGESAVVHFVQSDLARLSDEACESDNDPAVVRTMETLSVVGSDAPAFKQEKETGSSGGIPSR